MTLQPQKPKYIFSSSVYRTFSRKYHMVGHNASIHKVIFLAHGIPGADPSLIPSIP